MIIIIRGHIRNAFETQDLYNLIKKLYEDDKKLKIFIHTWNCFSNNISWRKIEPNNNPVNEEIIYEYFKDFKHIINHVIIDDDKRIELIGNLEGNINGGPMPIIGWKNYWYGKYKIINYIYNLEQFGNDEIVLNLRFDLFTYPGNTVDVGNCVDFVKNNKDIQNKNIFFYNHERIGIDNVYIGNINTIYLLSKKFYYELDEIFEIHNNTIHQECIVYRINLNL